jgi:hypothetical protein
MSILIIEDETTNESNGELRMTPSTKSGKERLRRRAYINRTLKGPSSKIISLKTNVARAHLDQHYENVYVYRFKNNNEKYLQIKSIAEEVVDRLLTERKSLLSSAIVPVVEALRMNPDRYALLFIIANMTTTMTI